MDQLIFENQDLLGLNPTIHEHLANTNISEHYNIQFAQDILPASLWKS